MAGTTGVRKAMSKRPIMLNTIAAARVQIQKTGFPGLINLLKTSIKVTFWKTFSGDGIRKENNEGNSLIYNW